MWFIGMENVVVLPRKHFTQEKGSADSPSLFADVMHGDACSRRAASERRFPHRKQLGVVPECAEPLHRQQRLALSTAPFPIIV